MTNSMLGLHSPRETSQIVLHEQPELDYTATVSSVFISYSRKDKDFVTGLHDELVADGRKVWVDWNGIPPSAEFMREIYSAIEASDAFIFVISPDSIASEVCLMELAHASRNGKRLIPVLFREVSGNLPGSVAAFHWLDFSPNSEFEQGMGKLKAALDLDLLYLREHTKLLTRAIEWKSATSKRALFLRADSLKAAEAWLVEAKSGKEPPLLEVQEDFIEGSRRQAQVEGRRRKQFVIIGAVFTLLLLAGITILYIRNKRAEKEAQAQNLATIVDGLIDHDPEAGLMIAIKAVEIARTEAAVSSLRKALLASRSGPSFSGHKGPIRSLKLNYPGDRLIVAGQDGAVRIWNTADGSFLTLDGQYGPVTCVDFSSDGKTFVTGGDDHALRLWDVRDGRHLEMHEGNAARINAVAFNPRVSTEFTSVGGDNLVWIWRRIGDSFGPTSKLEGHKSSIEAMDYSRDGKRIVTGSSDGGARVWDVSTGRQLAEFGFHHSPVKSVAFSPDGTLVLSASVDGVGRLWEVTSGHELLVFPAQIPEITRASFRTDGKWIVTTGSHGIPRIYSRIKDAPFVPIGQVNPDQWAEVGALGLHGGNVRNALFTRSDSILTTSDDGLVRLWSGYDPMNVPRPILLRGHLSSVTQVCLGSEFGGYSFATADNDGIAKVWREWRESVPSGRFLAGAVFPISSMVFSADSQFLGVGTNKGTDGGGVKVFNMLTGMWTPPLSWTDFGSPIHDREVRLLEFSPNGRYLVTAGSDAKVWDLDPNAKPEPIATFPSVEFKPNYGTLEWPNFVRSVRFDPTGRLFVFRNKSDIWSSTGIQPNPIAISASDLPNYGPFFARDGRIISAFRSGLIDIRSGTSGEVAGSLEYVNQEGPLTSFDLSFDGTRLIAANELGVARVWDLNRGSLIATLTGPKVPISKVRLSLDGRLAITTSGNQATLWSVEKQLVLASLRLHTAAVSDVNFSPDGSLAVTAGIDGRVFVWEADSGKLVTELNGHQDKVFFAIFSPNGRFIATGGSDGRVRVYPSSVFALPPALLTIAHQRVMRQLTQAEENELIH